jgi:hypothetical protein
VEVKENKHQIVTSSCFFLLGLVGKIERATHIDINRDGYIGGPPGYYPPPHANKKH